MKSKNQTESLKFRKEDGVLSNPDNNVLTSEQHRIWKRRNKVKVALAAGTAVVGVGGGIGAGYAIGHSQNNQPEPTPTTTTPTLSIVISNNTLKLGDIDSFATLSVTEINADSWKTPTLTFDNNPSSTNFTTTWADTDDTLTKIITITLNPDSESLPDHGPHTITISATGYADITETITVLPADAPKPTKLEIAGVVPIIGNKDTEIVPSPRLYCATDTGIVVNDAKYAIASDSRLPDGLGIDGNTGVISGTPSGATGGAIACTINVTSVSYTSLSGSVDIQITIGAQIAKSLVVSGAPANAFGNVGSDLQQINLTCVTDTGITVDDAQYSASNLPAGLDITLADRIGTISGTPTIDGKISCIITVTSAKYGLFDNSTNIDFTISPANTLLISLASLQNNTTLAEACNLEINPSSGVLNKKSSWDAMKNGTFNEYLDDLSYIVTTIQFEGVSSVGGSTFDGCTALQSDGVIKNIRFVQDLTTISDYAFSGCTGLKTIDLSSTHITSIGGWVFYNCTELTAITIPSSLESISNGVFEGCTSLTSIDLSKVVSLTSIGSGAFQGCGALTTVDLSKTAVTVIGWGVFQSCAELTTINFPDSLEVIGDHAFEGCAAITTVDLSKTAVTSIASWAFYNCTSLTALNLSRAMFAEGNSASIGGSAFKGCTSLQEIFIPERAVPQQGGSSNNSNAFEGCAGDGKIYYYDEGGKDVAEWFKDFFDGLSSWTVEEA